jgi:hypothetical protein
MSPMFRSGLVGVSIHTAFERPGTIEPRTASMSLTGAGLCSRPQRLATLSISRWVPP